MLALDSKRYSTGVEKLPTVRDRQSGPVSETIDQNKWLAAGEETRIGALG